MAAIFVGRFQPLHKGHLEAIKWILKKERKIVIVIGSIQEFFTQENPFLFEERKKMLEISLLDSSIKNFEIYGVPDFLNDVLWAKKVLEITKLKPKNTLVFTQNPWTKKCFEKIGVKVKPHPMFFNRISATQIRKKIWKKEKWENLIPKVLLNYLREIKGPERINFLKILPEERIVNFIREKVKASGLKGGIIGISGGLDSSVTAFLAKEALREKIFLLNINFEKKYPLENNISLLEENLGLKIKKIYFDNIYKNFLERLPKGNKIVRGNLKSRLRMATIYYFANLYHLLVIGTANRSEIEIGYFTKFGDGGVDVLPLGDLYKTEVIEMAKRLKLPSQILETIPSANLWIGQTDQKEIGLDYQKLDTVLKLLFQGFKEKEISKLTNIPQKKVKEIIERKIKNAHKSSLPPICTFKKII